MDYKEKYIRALERARKIHHETEFDYEKGMMEEIFPEIKDSGDERIRQAIINYLKKMWGNCKDNVCGVHVEDAIAWLENQSPKENNVNEETNGPTAYGKYVDECLNEAAKHFFSEGEDKYTVADLFYAGVRCGQSWPETQAENKFNFSDLRIWKYIVDMVLTEKDGIGNYLDNPDTERIAKKLQEKYGNIEKQDKKPQGKTASEAAKEERVDNQNCVKCADKVEPKFHVGNWYQCTKDFFGKGVTFDKNTAYYCSQEGCLQNEYGCHIAIVKDLYNNFKLWSIEDARDGDVLSINWREGDDSWEKIIIFKKYHNKGVKGLYYLPCVEGYGNTFKNGKLAFQEEVPYYSKTWTCNLHPATKAQRDLLFTKIKEAGYEYDNEKKELKKFEPKFNVGDWIVTGDSFGKIVRRIDAISFNLIDKVYVVSDENGLIYNNISFDSEHKWHKWTIADVENGDVVVDKSDGTIGIFQSIGHHPDGGSYNDPSYCFLYCRYDDGFFYADFEHGNTINSNDLIPATKEQRELLFEKMTQAGWEWNSEKKELSKQILKITPKFCVGQMITDNNGTWYKILNIKCLDDWYYELYDIGEDKTYLKLCSIIDERFVFKTIFENNRKLNEKI